MRVLATVSRRPVLVVLVICLLAVWPFVSRPGLPQATDAELHIFRLAELSRLIRGGEFYPRWAPNFYYGYGYPIFNYYAPLTYYLGLPIELLPGLDAVSGVKFVFVLGILLAGWGMFGFVAENWGDPAGYIAAAVYLYTPYIQYVDPHARGDLAEAFSFALFPLTLWSLDRLRRQAGPARFILATLLVAAIILCHNLMAMLFFGLLLGWALWQLFFRQPNTINVPCFIMPLVAGVGLAAFFWLPVALEQNAVNLSTLIGDGGHFDFRNHFLTIRELIRFSPRLDWGATEPEFALNLGVGQWLLAGLGIVGWRIGRRQSLTFFVVGLAFLLFLMQAVSTPLWELVPLLPFLQFPWRLLGPAAALLAIVAGGGVGLLVENSQLPLRQWLPAGAITLVLLFALPLSQVPPWPADFGGTNIPALTRIELLGRWLGTTSTADFVPATVDVLPRRNDALIEQLLANQQPIDRVNRLSLPEVTTVTSEEISPLHFRYRVASEREFRLRLFLFAFPGWQATIDGKVVAGEIGRPEGFLVVVVPAGNHIVEVQFVNTPARQLAWLLSGLSLVVTLFMAWRQRRDPLPTLPPAQVATINPLPMVIIILATHWLWLQPAGLLHDQSTGREVIPAGHPHFANLGGQVALLAYDAPQQARPGQTIPITLYWKAEQPLTINYQSFVHLLWPDGTIITQSDKLNPGEFPTEWWPTDKYVRDVHELLIPANVPAGAYSLSAGLWVQSEGWRLPLLNPVGQQVGDNIILFQLEVGE